MTHEPSADELHAMAERLAAAAEAAQPRQLGSTDLQSMTPQEVEDARARGQLRDLLGGADPSRKPRTSYLKED